MTPKPVTELLAEVKAALQQATKPRPRIHSHGYSPANNCEECRWLDAQNVIQKNGLEWLGALVQAVEDQQRRAEHERSNAVAALRKYEEATREADALEAEVAQLRADGQRLRDAVKYLLETRAPEHTTSDCPGDAISEWTEEGVERGCAVCTLRATLAPPRDAP